MPTFTIAKGVKCKVRRLGDLDWRPHTTTRDHQFTSYTLADCGGTWVFELGEWQMKVPASLVEGRGPKAETVKPKGPLRSGGRGSSRRKAQSLVRKWKRGTR